MDVAIGPVIRARPVTCSRKRTARVARRARSRLSSRRLRDRVSGSIRPHPYIAVQSPSLSSGTRSAPPAELSLNRELRGRHHPVPVVTHPDSILEIVGLLLEADGRSST